MQRGLRSYKQALLKESNTTKSEANTKFASLEYTIAIDLYNTAISTCPNYLDYEVAVLRSNIAACHLKLEDWKAAVDEATKALDGLDKLQGRGKFEKKKDGAGAEGAKTDEKNKDEEEVDEEIISEGASKAEDISEKGKRDNGIDRIRAKALMRRARARSELGGWSSLAGAEEGRRPFVLPWKPPLNEVVDYKTLSKMKNLSTADMKIVQKQLAQLPPRTKAAQEKEMADMMGKLKSLGNGILKPFGLSTDNFQMVKDENTGGYSMNFNQNAG